MALVTDHEDTQRVKEHACKTGNEVGLSVMMTKLYASCPSKTVLIMKIKQMPKPKSLSFQGPYEEQNEGEHYLKKTMED